MMRRTAWQLATGCCCAQRAPHAFAELALPCAPSIAATMGREQATPSPAQPDMSHYDTKNSPFLDLDNPFTWWEVFKMVLLLPLLIPRCLLALLALLTLAACSAVAIYGCDPREPLPESRRHIVLLSRHCTGFLLLLLGFRVRVTGWEHYKQAQKEHAIILFNHISYVDSVAMLWLFAPSGVSKASNADIPLIGSCIKSFQNVYVPREKIDFPKNRTAEGFAAVPKVTPTNGNAAGRTADEKPKPSIAQILHQRAHDKRYPMLCMAPEGTCSDGRCLLQFRRGAFVPGVPVLPVCLTYSRKHLNPAWTIIHEGWHFVRLMCQFINTLDIDLQPVYCPSAEEIADPGLYADNVRQVYAKATGLPLVEQSQRHFMALCRARVAVSWDGQRVTAPPGVVDGAGFVNLTPYDKKAC